MFSNETCAAAVGRLNATEQIALRQEATKRACSINEALLQVALENLQQQLYSFRQGRARLVLVKG